MSFAPPSGPPVGPFAPSPPPRGTRRRRGERTLGADGTPDWPWWSPFAAFFGALIAGQTILIFLVVFASLFEADRPDDADAPSGVLLAGNIVQDVFFVLFTVGVAWVVAGGVRREDFGIRMPDPRRAAAALAITAVTYLVLSTLYLALVGGEEQDIPQELGADRNTAAAIGTVLLVCVAAPIGEEVFFRGFLFRALIRPLRVWGAAVIAGLLFGLVHVAGSPISVLPALMILGIGLCWLYWRTGSLLPGIALHLVNNAIALVTVLDWKAYWVPVIIVCAGSVIALAYRLTVRLSPEPQPAL